MPKLTKLLPENEEQFDLIVAQMNNAIGEDFDRKISKKRANKFRSTIAKGLGFPDGFQEIKSHWSKKNDSQLFEELSDQEFEALSCRLSGVGANGRAYFPIDVMGELLELLSVHFPIVNGAFVGEADSPHASDSSKDIVPSDCGWQDHPIENQGIRSKSVWLPLHLSGVVVGYATDVKLASVLIAILKTISIEMPNFIDKTIENGDRHLWSMYVKERTFTATKEPVATLRMDGMDYGLSIPFDTGSYQNDKITLVGGTHWEDVKHDVDADVFVWKGMKFDFVSTYHPDPKLTLTIYSVQDDSVNIGDADGIEFFSDGIHVMKADDDTDVLELDRQAALRYNFKFG
tara:strand:- start:942 stop:1976 length:1035 start_codon:yes stop_codon:yes gene_type:complete